MEHTHTKIQEEGIPLALELYRDVIGLAETGSGKTAAFAIPILARTAGEELLTHSLDFSRKVMFSLRHVNLPISFQSYSSKRLALA